MYDLKKLPANLLNLRKKAGKQQKDVAKAIVEEFHNEKVLSQVVSKPSTKSNKGRKPKTEFTVEKGENIRVLIYMQINI